MQCTECVAPLNKIGVLLMQYVDFLFFRKCWNKSALKKLGGNWRNLNNEWLYDDIKKLTNLSCDEIVFFLKDSLSFRDTQWNLYKLQ